MLPHVPVVVPFVSFKLITIFIPVDRIILKALKSCAVLWVVWTKTWFTSHSTKKVELILGEQTNIYNTQLLIVLKLILHIFWKKISKHWYVFLYGFFERFLNEEPWARIWFISQKESKLNFILGCHTNIPNEKDILWSLQIFFSLLFL